MAGPLTKGQRDALPDNQFAVPSKRKLPLPDERHTRLAWEQLGRTQGLTDLDRAEGRKIILRRADDLGIDTTKWKAVTSLTSMRIDAMALNMPDVADHPNKMPFSGVLTKIGQPSDAAPHGSKGKRIFLTAAAAEDALASLIGMAVDYTPDFDGHDAQRKLGVITGAEIEGDDLLIEGFIYAADFPEEAAEIKANKNALGFSFEAQRILVESLDTDPLVITACVFTGAAILLKDKAAYVTTSLAASAATGELEMTKEELEAILASALKPVTDDIASLKAGQTALDEKIEAGKELHAKVAPHADKLRAAAKGMEAAGIGIHATRGHVAVLSRMADCMEAEAMNGSMPHIFRDEAYPMYAATESKVEAAAGENKEVQALKDQVASLETKLKDGIAASRELTNEPERKTLPPQITALLAKADISVPADGGKLDVANIDRVLASSNLSISERLRIKTELRHAGTLD